MSHKDLYSLHKVRSRKPEQYGQKESAQVTFFFVPHMREMNTIYG